MKLSDRSFEHAKRLGAGQRHYQDIELAVAHLHGMLDATA
jgi:hypothetical protein